MRLLQGVRVLNIVSISLFLICCYYMLVNSQEIPSRGDNSGNDGALTVVPQEEEGDEAEVTVENDVDFSTEINSEDVFYPSNEWKTIKQGQAVPAGLHVRLNLETGKKEAKLMEGDTGHKYWKSGDKEGMLNPKEKFFTPQELKEALKEFKTTKLDEENKEREKEVLKKFRKYDDLKKEMADLEAEIKTDGEIITEMYQKLNSSQLDDNEKQLLLEDLEFYLHQIDNAQLFCDLGGMTLLLKGLNDSLALTREQSAFAIGSAVQSNPKVQIKALEAGALPQLIRSLSVEPVDEVRPRILFAISSLVRHFPYAQKKFLELGGLSALKNLFSSSEKFAILQVKVVTLLHDLIREKELVLSEELEYEEKVKQYNQVHIKEAVKEQGMCKWLPRLLQAPDHDSREKVLQAMLTLGDSCKEDFEMALPQLQMLYQEYSRLAAGEIDQDDQYFKGIAQDINSLLSSLSFHPSSKDEL